MPYKHAHYYVLLLFPAAFLAFWFQFFSRLSDATLAVHVNSWTATLWIFLLAGQSWTIHHNHFSAHRIIGTASLALFPVFLASFFLVIQSEAATVLAGNEYRAVFAPGIGVLTLVAAIAIGFLYYNGLKNRRTPQLHARYMFAIPFLFLESIFGRLFNDFVPWLFVESLDDIRNVYLAIHITQALAIAFALFLYLQNRKYGAPFLAVCLALLLQSIGLEVFDDVRWWREIYLSLPSLPMQYLFAPGLVLGVLVAIGGWRAGKAS